jgi:hypothetical protein
MLSRALMLASAGIVLALGLVHLLYTFHGTKLHPRDAAVQQAMRTTHLRLTSETTVWKAWIGFNASHSMAALLFGALYGYLALAQPELLFRSAYLQLTGLAMLGGFLVLARLYWFSIPFAGIGLACACYLASVLAERW